MYFVKALFLQEIEKLLYLLYYKGIYYIIGGQNEEIRTLNTILKFKVSENKMLDP